MGKRRTDLALEAASALQVEGRVPGVVTQEWVDEGVPITVVEIRSSEGAEAVGKPVGRYVTLDLGPVRRREQTAFGRSVRMLAQEISKLLPPGNGPALVVCLGNRDVTPDALGPMVHDHLLVTRHLIDAAPEHFGAFRPVAALSLGVLGSTGVESGALARAAVGEVRPEVVIAVDALASGSLGRLCATVQVSDTGISPGSGVGNHRQALDRDTLDVPVVAVGVPTVVEAATLAQDLLAEAGRDDLDPKTLGGQGERLFVTPRDIDVRVAECAKVIAYAINLALQPGLTVEDLEMLLE